MNTQTTTGSGLTSRWNLENFCTDYSDNSWLNDLTELKKSLQKAEELLKDRELREKNPQFWLKALVDLLSDNGNRVIDLCLTTFLPYNLNSENREAQKAMNLLDNEFLKLRQQDDTLREILKETDITLPGYEYYLSFQRGLAEKTMSREEESLERELSRHTSLGWQKLSQTLFESTRVSWEQGEEKNTQELNRLLKHEDPHIREKAYSKKEELFQKIESALTALFNNSRGYYRTLNKKRGWNSSLEKSLYHNRVSEKTFNTMMEVLEESLPSMRKYYLHKARLLNRDKLSWAHKEAPVCTRSEKWTWDEACGFVLDNFRNYSPELAEFSEDLIKKGRVDGLPQKGKNGGGFCIISPKEKSSRILINFDGYFNWVMTLAHELGHAWHNHVQMDLPVQLKKNPTSLTETASLFAESLIVEEALKNAEGDTAFYLLEKQLSYHVDMITRLLTEHNLEILLEKEGEKRYLLPEELRTMSREAGKRVYGESLTDYHPWLWVNPGLSAFAESYSYCGFAYTFGLLFTLGLFSLRDKKENFQEFYRELLLNTGRKNCVDLAKDAGFDIEKRDFWQSGVDIIISQIEKFTEL